MVKALGIITHSRLILLLKVFIEEQQQPNYIIQNLTTIPNKKNTIQLSHLPKNYMNFVIK